MSIVYCERQFGVDFSIGIVPLAFSASSRIIPVEMGNSRAFSLLELIVVIVIIAFIGGVILPSMTRRHLPARKAACKNNLKNIGLLCKMYSQDYDDSWPYEETKGNNARQNLHLLFLTGVADNSEIFICPSSETDSLPKITAPADLATSDYAYHDGSPESYADSNLCMTVVCGDAWGGHSDPSDDKWTHAEGTNTLWGDGHVEWRNGEYVGINGPYTDVK